MGANHIPQYPSFREWLGSMLEENNHQSVELFAVCVWQIWCARNEYCFEKIYIAPS